MLISEILDIMTNNITKNKVTYVAEIELETKTDNSLSYWDIKTHLLVLGT